PSLLTSSCSKFGRDAGPHERDDHEPMPMGPEADALRLRRALRNLVALSAVPAAWVGREPAAIAAGLADVLVNSLYLDFAFVRLCDPSGNAAVEISRGSAWQAFPEWLQYRLGVNGCLARREIVRDVGY